jgi:hypothetical protein
MPDKVGSSAFSQSGKASVDNQLLPPDVVSPASSAFFSSYHFPKDDMLKRWCCTDILRKTSEHTRSWFDCGLGVDHINDNKTWHEMGCVETRNCASRIIPGTMSTTCTVPVHNLCDMSVELFYTRYLYLYSEYSVYRHSLLLAINDHAVLFHMEIQ